MGLISPPIPTIGQPNSTEDQDIVTALTTIRDEFNGNIDNANIKAGAGIVYSKLSLSNGIVNADVSSSAAILHTKLANITAGQVLMGNASNIPTATAISGDATLASSGALTIAANAVGNAEMADNSIGGEELTDSLAQKLGVNETSGTRRGEEAIATSENTTSTTYTDLATVGPDITVNVTGPALVFIFVRCQIRANGGATGAVDLYEDGASITGSTSILTSSSATFETNHSTPGSGIGTSFEAWGGPLVLFRASGTYVYKLMYKRTGGTSADFQQRRLHVLSVTF